MLVFEYIYRLGGEIYARSQMSMFSWGTWNDGNGLLSRTQGIKGANLEGAGTWETNLNHCYNHPICE